MSRISIGSSLVAIALAVLTGSAAHTDGNVSATVQNGLLVLRGDSGDNQVSITTDGAPAGGVTLIPRAGTTINGESPAFLDVPDIPRGVRASFGGGEDTFGGSELETFPGDLAVNMGGENDTLSFTDLFADEVQINMGGGDDNFGFDTLACNTLRIRASGGSDGLFWSGGGVAGESSIGLGSGDDLAIVENVAFGGPARITLSGGDDLIRLQLETSFAGTANLSGGTGSADALASDGTTLFATSPIITGFEQ